MASHPHTLGGASALPLSVALAIIPSLPRPLLSRLVARAIERLDEMDGQIDDEDDDPGGGNVEDEGETAGAEDTGEVADYAEDQRSFSWRYGTYRSD